MKKIFSFLLWQSNTKHENKLTSKFPETRENTPAGQDGSRKSPFPSWVQTVVSSRTAARERSFSFQSLKYYLWMKTLCVTNPLPRVSPNTRPAGAPTGSTLHAPRGLALHWPGRALTVKLATPFTPSASLEISGLKLRLHPQLFND